VDKKVIVGKRDHTVLFLKIFGKERKNEKPTHIGMGA